jgi:hypothetical protein
VPESEDEKDVLGNLPRRRPGIESKRRVKARSSKQKSSAARPGRTEPQLRSEPGELEQLARASAKLAAEAAGVGLKLAGRTIGGLGRVVGRR